MKMHILTPWTGKGIEGDPFRPLAADLHPMSWTDITGQAAANIQPDPNLYVIEADCDEETIIKIKADSRFLILCGEGTGLPKPYQIPTSAAFNQFCTGCAQLGVKAADLETALGAKVSARTWGQIGQSLTGWLKLRTKTG